MNNEFNSDTLNEIEKHAKNTVGGPNRFVPIKGEKMDILNANSRDSGPSRTGTLSHDNGRTPRTET